MVSDNKSSLSDLLLTEIVSAVAAIGSYGSVEIYIQDGMVTQITSRTIKKTKVTVAKKNHVLARNIKDVIKSKKTENIYR